MNICHAEDVLKFGNVPPTGDIPIYDREQILDSDIMYKDDLVSILHPHIKKGIIIFSNYKQPSDSESLCTYGLHTGEELFKQGKIINPNPHKIMHPYIFFRAPYHSIPIDYTSIETEIDSSFGNITQIHKEPNKVFIRVDPSNTYVFSSEIRAHKFNNISEVNNSKKTLMNYLSVIKNNTTMKTNVLTQYSYWYNLFSSKIYEFPVKYEANYPFDKYPIERNSEILVSIPHLTPNYFVKCT